MAVPTIVSVTPGIGHTGGQTLVEIVGTNFRLPTPAVPVPPLPTPASPPSVRVTFGGVACTVVAVVSTSLIRCLTPEHALSGMPERVATQDGPPARAAIPASDVVVTNIDDAGVAIPSESVTRAAAFSFHLPDLSKPGITKRVLERLVEMLQIQLLEEDQVSLNPHTDFDPATGDLLNICHFARVPAIALVDVRRAESQIQTPEPQEIAIDATRFIVRRAPVYYDYTLTLVAASDNQGELFTLDDAIGGFFDKNPYLYIDRDPDLPNLGKVRFAMKYLGNPAYSGRIESSNLLAFQADLMILRVPRADIPGLPASELEGVPSHYPAEAMYERGKTLDENSLDVEKK